jgi:hypothetical protein
MTDVGTRTLPVRGGFPIESCTQPMILAESEHRTIAIKGGHATDEVVLDHDCPARGAQADHVVSQVIAMSGSDAAIVNLGGEFVVEVTCPLCSLVQIVHLKGTAASDLGR